MTREMLEEKMKDLPNPPCRVNLIQQVWEIMNSETEELKKENLDKVKRLIKKDKQLTKAKELLAKWVELYKPKLEGFPKPPIQVDTEQFLSEVEK